MALYAENLASYAAHGHRQGLFQLLQEVHRQSGGSGSVKVDRHAAAKALEVTYRTIKNRLSRLVEGGYCRFDKYTGKHYPLNMDKLCPILFGEEPKRKHFRIRDTKDLKTVLFVAHVQEAARITGRKRVKKSPAKGTGEPTSEHRFGISDSYMAKRMGFQRTWARNQRKRAEKKGMIEVKRRPVYDEHSPDEVRYKRSDSDFCMEVAQHRIIKRRGVERVIRYLSNKVTPLITVERKRVR